MKVQLPAFTVTGTKPGQITRQCTRYWKIAPLRRGLSDELQRLGLPKRPGAAELWIGISTDEAARMKDADVQWIRHRWPLAMDLGMSRKDCVTWLGRQGLPVPPKSSCVFCPYHHGAAWQQMRERGGEDWREAVRVDAEIRHLRPPGLLYLHPSCRPLSEVDFATGQQSLWDLECSGLCEA